jgi:hypothetical protein
MGEEVKEGDVTESNRATSASLATEGLGGDNCADLWVTGRTWPGREVGGESVQKPWGRCAQQGEEAMGEKGGGGKEARACWVLPPGHHSHREV